MAARLIFLGGKGGVGKSTISALLSLAYARAGKRVLLVSFDPAHNQRDIFQRDLGDSPVECFPGLRIVEPDPKAWTEKYLRDIEKQMRSAYRYLTAINIDKYFGVIRYSPGLDEFAMSLMFRTILRDIADTDILVFDMPPTALALRFFAAPSLSAVWAERLIELRKTILDRKQMITRVTLGKTEVESDRVLRHLEHEVERYHEQQALLCSERSSIIVVMNTDAPSIREAKRIFGELQELGMTPRHVILNHRVPDNGNRTLPDDITVALSIPFSPTPLLGVEALNDWLDTHADSLPLDRVESG